MIIFDLNFLKSALYRTDYSGRGDLAERQQHLGKFLRMLQVLFNKMCKKLIFECCFAMFLMCKFCLEDCG